MSSTFWAFMILASLLIAYCSEYRAPGPLTGLGFPARSLPQPRRGAPRRCIVASAWRAVPGPGRCSAGPGGLGADGSGLQALCYRAHQPVRASGDSPAGPASGPGRHGASLRGGAHYRRAVAALAQASDLAELRALIFPPATLPPGTCGDAAAEPERDSSGRSAAWVPTRG
ncbi:hypothetical protein NN561_002220 [Cricetulus griseus]